MCMWVGGEDGGRGSMRSRCRSSGTGELDVHTIGLKITQMEHEV